MDENNRVKRPAPERTEPIRQWTETFGPKHAAASVQSDASEPRDAAYQTINDAYRLIDDYMRQGQQVAENFWLPFAETGAPFREAPERFMRALGDMTMAWVEVMQQWTSSTSGAKPHATGKAAPFAGVEPSSRADEMPASPFATTTSQSTLLRVVVVARMPFELVLDVKQPVDIATLTITELRDHAQACALTDVRIEQDEQADAYVRVVVPEGQAEGTYNGLFIDQTTRRPRGTISVTLLPTR